MAVLPNVNIGIGEKLNVAFPKIHNVIDNLNLLQNGQFNVLDYGADPSGVASSSAAIQAAVNAASVFAATALGLGGTVKIPAGIYSITAGIELKSYVHIVCDPGAFFSFADGYAGNMYQVSAGNMFEFGSIDGGVYGRYAGTRTWTFLDIQSSVAATGFMMFCSFQNMNVFNCNVGINLNITSTGWINGNRFHNILFWRPIKGVVANQAATGQGLQGNSFDMINIQFASAVTTHGIDINCVLAPYDNKFDKIGFWDMDPGQVAIDTNTLYSDFTNLAFAPIPADMTTAVLDSGSWNKIEFKGSFYSPFQYPVRYWGSYGERTDVNKLRIEANNAAGNSAAPAGDIGIKLKSYTASQYATESANSAARVISRNQAASNSGSYLVFQTHGTASDVVNYLDSLIVKPSGGLRLLLAGCPSYANNAAAIAGGLIAGDLYRTGGDPDSVCIVH